MSKSEQTVFDRPTGGGRFVERHDGKWLKVGTGEDIVAAARAAATPPEPKPAKTEPKPKD